MNSIDVVAKELGKLFKEMGSRPWVHYTTGFDLGVTEAQNKIAEFKKDPKNFKIILDALNRNSTPLEKRKAELIHRAFKDYHLSDRVLKLKEETDRLADGIMDKINKFRAQINGKEYSSTELSKVLEQPDRKLRHQAFEAHLPLNQIVVDNGFIDLLNARKELAIASGHQNFVDYVLDKEELSSDLFKDWPTICAKRMEQYRKKSQFLAQHHLGVDELMPWDQAYLKNKITSFNQTQVDMSEFFGLLEKTFLKYNFDISQLNLTFDIFPRKNKSEWGYNFTIDPGKDSRILANVSNRFSDYWVLLHETAHGAHYMGLNEEDSMLHPGISGIVAEGFANFFGDQCYSREFLSELFDQATTEKAYLEFKKLASVSHFQDYRNVASTLFDQQLYLRDLKTADDIQELRQSFGSNILGEKGFDVPWAKLIHHTSHPIYLHNYFLGDVMSENMRLEFSNQHKGLMAEDHPAKFGQFWKDQLLNPSGRDPFLKLYQNVFGKKLSITEYIDGKCLALS